MVVKIPKGDRHAAFSRSESQLFRYFFKFSAAPLWN